MTQGIMPAGAVAAVLIAMATTTAAAQEGGSSLSQALSDGTFSLAFRHRYEYVDQTGIAKDANASLLRSRITYESASYRDFSFLVEMDDLRAIGPDDYDSTRNGRTDRPIVADPEATDFNQGLIRYTGFDDTVLTIGRQRINHANQRYVGGVGWRQNEQTFDALELSHTISDSFSARYTYIDNVNRVQGPESGSPPADFRSSSHLLDADYKLESGITIRGYGYFLDFDNAPGASNQTLGVRVTGTGTVNEGLTIPYTVEFARQSDNANNTADYNANYYLLEAGLRSSNFDIKLSHEVLEGNGRPGEAFSTPLATLHPFQGWADKFLTTPAGGIEDTYVTFSGRAGPVNLTAIYHDFSAESGGASYGDEIDLSAGWAFAGNFAILLKLASYSADAHSTDTDKFWVMLSATF